MNTTTKFENICSIYLAVITFLLAFLAISSYKREATIQKESRELRTQATEIKDLQKETLEIVKEISEKLPKETSEKPSLYTNEVIFSDANPGGIPNLRRPTGKY
jgi:cell division protein FtsL